MKNTPPQNPPDQPTANQPKPKKKPKILIFIALIILLIVTNLTTYFFFKNQTTTTPETTSNQEEEKTETETNSPTPTPFVNNWTEVESSNLFLSPSYVSLRQNENNKYISCLDFEGYRDLETIKPLIEDKQELIDGLMVIEDHTFTSPVKDASGKPLDPIISKYKIEYTNICATTGKFFVLFLTTQAKKTAFNFVSPVYAAGGWLGDSHLAIIENGETKIYERFPFNADLITLPKEDNDDVILRFGAYYNCDNIASVTDKHIFITCHSNLYALDLEQKTFTELAICGSKIKDGTYMTADEACYDQNGSQYYFQEGSIE